MADTAELDEIGGGMRATLDVFAAQLAAEDERRLTKAVDHLLGAGQWAMDSLRGRLQHITYENDHNRQEWYLDGHLLMRATPYRFEQEGLKLRAVRQVWSLGWAATDTADTEFGATK